MIPDDPRLDPHLPMTAAVGIDTLADRFEESWRTGKPQRVESILDEFPPRFRLPLLRELLAIELAYRLRRGDAPPRSEMEDRFPDDLELINHLFEEVQVSPASSSLLLMSQTVGPSVVESAVTVSGRTEDYLPPTTAPTPVVSLQSLATRSTNEDPSAADWMPSRIHRYPVEGVLGRGAFGTVFLARDDELRRTVAIKVPRRSRVATESDIETFLNEARLVASLDHPAIVPVYDAGRTDDGLCFVVSKHIPGRDLARRLKAGRLDAAEAANIIARAAEALDHAHRRGLVHRDIKPANLLLDDQGQVYVADFGLALTLADYEREQGLAGTPAYMSPEQARRDVQSLDGRSDLFSLGIVFYELLTGNRPFRGDSLAEMLEQIQFARPSSPHWGNPHVPLELSRVCLRCLAKEPEKRYRSAGELVNALRRWQKSTPLRVPEANPEGLPTSRLIPPRFQPFGAMDSGVYLNLLPPPAAGATLTSPIAFWKERLEERGTERVLRLRALLLSGPAGVGKSSLLRAGVLPRLAPFVRPVVIEAERGETSARLWAALVRHDEEFPSDLPLADGLRWLCDRAREKQTKLLLIVDHFERYLHEPGDDAQLAEVLSVCDGVRLQCVFVVRDESTRSASRWLDRHGVPIVEGENHLALRPALVGSNQTLLMTLGQSLGRLPEDEAEMAVAQRLFLQQAIRGLAGEDGVVPLRLAQFALAMSGVEWKASVLSELGGPQPCLADLIDEQLRLLEGTRDGPSQQTARTLLGMLTPPNDGDFVVRTEAELRAQTTQAGLGRHFDAVMNLLDRELRLVTPSSSSGRMGYRLADELACAAVRRWLHRKPGARSRTAGHMKSPRSAAWANTSWSGSRQRGIPSAKLVVGLLVFFAGVFMLGNLLMEGSLVPTWAELPATDLSLFASLSQYVVAAVLLAVVFGLGVLVGRQWPAEREREDGN